MLNSSLEEDIGFVLSCFNYTSSRPTRDSRDTKPLFSRPATTAKTSGSRQLSGGTQEHGRRAKNNNGNMQAKPVDNDCWVT